MIGHENVVARKIKEDGREYHLALAPVKRLLQEGSRCYGKSGDKAMQVSEAAALVFRQALENYALDLAEEIAIISDDAGRNTIRSDDVYLATGV